LNDNEIIVRSQDDQPVFVGHYVDGDLEIIEISGFVILVDMYANENLEYYTTGLMV
jgi:hypothetical protein